VSDLIASGAVSSESVSELARLGQKGISLIEQVGTYVGAVVGTGPHDLAHVAGLNWVHEVHKRQKAVYAAKTEALLAKIAKERLSEPSPSVIVPLLEAAQNETREELQNMWAALIANCMVDGGRKVRRDFFSAVQRMEPADAVILVLLRGEISDFQRERTSRGFTDVDVDVSLSALKKLDCARNEPTGPLGWRPTSFGLALLEACTVS
jgi:hypothetical protein